MDNVPAKIFQLIPKIIKEVGAVPRDTHNPMQNYDYRSLDKIYEAVNPVFAEHGVFCVPVVLEMTREEHDSSTGKKLLYTILTVEFTFFADDGSYFKTITVGEAMDLGDKSANKAMSAAHKYALTQVLCLKPGEGADTESESHEVKGKTTKPQSTKPYKKKQKDTDPVDTPACPCCGEVKSVRPENAVDGGWFCWSKKGGCGNNFTMQDIDTEGLESSIAPQPTTEENQLTDQQIHLNDLLDKKFGKGTKNRKDWLQNTYRVNDISEMDKNALDNAIKAVTVMIDVQDNQQEIPY
jgi:hypothetical protein